MYKFLLFSLLALALCAPSANADASDPFAVYHVAQNGSDSNPGTKARPFATIGKALSMSTSYETIEVHAGEYPWFQDTRNRSYGPVIIRGAAGEPRPVLWGGQVAGGAHLRFENLKWLRHIELRTHPTKPDRPARSIQIVNNEFTRNADTRGDCIIIRDSTRNVLIEDNHIHGCLNGIITPGGTKRTASQVVNARNITVRKNLLENFVGDGLQFAHWSNATIDGNVIRHMKDPAQVQHPDGIQITGNSHGIRIVNNEISHGGQLIYAQGAISGPNSDLLIRNNLLHHSANWGMQLMETLGVRVINNTSLDARYAGIILGRNPVTGPANYVVINNVADMFTTRGGGTHLARSNNLWLKTTSTALPTDIVGKDPQFVDYAGGDYRLRSSSPALGNGEPRYSLNRGWDPAADGLAGEPAPVVPGTVPLPPGYSFPSSREPETGVTKAGAKRKPAAKRPGKRRGKAPRVRSNRR